MPRERGLDSVYPTTKHNATAAALGRCFEGSLCARGPPGVRFVAFLERPNDDVSKSDCTVFGRQTDAIAVGIPEAGGYGSKLGYLGVKDIVSGDQVDLEGVIESGNRFDAGPRGRSRRYCRSFW